MYIMNLPTRSVSIAGTLSITENELSGTIPFEVWEIKSIGKCSAVVFGDTMFLSIM